MRGQSPVSWDVLGTRALPLGDSSGQRRAAILLQVADYLCCQPDLVVVYQLYGSAHQHGMQALRARIAERFPNDLDGGHRLKILERASSLSRCSIVLGLDFITAMAYLLLGVPW
ncbi:MAG: hypothetical protein K6T83_14430 [Alicyclobacillus sp.]|nr:hypothetical protein [Alicyclobacillus sp.]